MGKCLAGCDQPYVEIKVCDTCFHKDVCGDKDYLTENNCFDFCSKDEIQRWKDLAEQGKLVELPCKVRDEIKAGGMKDIIVGELSAAENGDLISRKALIKDIGELLKSPYAKDCKVKEAIEIVMDLCVKQTQ